MLHVEKPWKGQLHFEQRLANSRKTLLRNYVHRFLATEIRKVPRYSTVDQP